MLVNKISERPYKFIRLLHYFIIMFFNNILWLTRSNKVLLSTLLLIILLFTNCNNAELLLNDGGLGVST
jgi:hypothetical protein